ncbi:hypothetical protein ACKWRH_21530 [Bradyrhizobium sp. Pa8]
MKCIAGTLALFGGVVLWVLLSPPPSAEEKGAFCGASGYLSPC